MKRRHVRSGGLLEVVALAVLACGTAWGQSVEGPWFARLFAPSPNGSPGYDTTCHVDVSTAGSSIAFTQGGCRPGPIFPATPVSGSWDPGTGAISISRTDLSYQYLPCTTWNAVGAFAPASRTISLDWQCSGGIPVWNQGTITLSRCQNGVLDPGEECDNGPEDPFMNDCCSPTCQFNPAKTDCQPDGTACTRDECDAAGVCLHVPLPRQVGSTCETDDNPCTDDVCEPSGACGHTPVALDTPCDPDLDPTQVGILNVCTRDVCDGAGTCTHPPQAGPCDSSRPCIENEACAGGACVGTPVASGMPCRDDGVRCTHQACDGAGACVFAACSACCAETSPGVCVKSPAASCDRPALAKGVLKLDYRKSNLIWKWQAGDVAGFPDPLTNDYALCVYDQDTVQASFDVLAAADVPAGGTCRGRSCWRTTSGLAKYLDADRTPDGVQSILLKSLASPRGRVELKAKGENLELRNPRYVLVPPLIDLWDYTQGPVVVQLRSGGQCWQTTFTTPRRLTGTAFVGAEGSPSGAFPAG